MINAIQTALSGLLASAKKVEASASNIANLSTAGSLDDPNNAPYAALTTQQQAVTNGAGGQGVRADFVQKDPPFVPAYDPDSPFANADGVIGVPNVNIAEEAVNLSVAKAAYKANIAVIKTADEMQDELLRALDKKA